MLTHLQSAFQLGDCSTKSHIIPDLIWRLHHRWEGMCSSISACVREPLCDWHHVVTALSPMEDILEMAVELAVVYDP